MKNFIIFLLLLLPFFAMAQPANKEDKRNEKESFVSNGTINGKTFFRRPVVVTVDWGKHVLLVDGGEHLFKVVKTVEDGQIYCFIETDEKKVFVLVYDTEGLRGLMCPKDEITLDIEISDIWAEMKNAKK